MQTKPEWKYLNTEYLLYKDMYHDMITFIGGICWWGFALWWICNSSEGWGCKSEGKGFSWTFVNFAHSLEIDHFHSGTDEIVLFYNQDTDLSWCFVFNRVVVLVLSKLLLKVLCVRITIKFAIISIHSFICFRFRWRCALTNHELLSFPALSRVMCALERFFC